MNQIFMYEKLPEQAHNRMLHGIEHLTNVHKFSMSATRKLIADYGMQGAIAKMVRNGTNNPGRIKNVKALIQSNLMECSAESIVLDYPQYFEQSLKKHAIDMLRYCGGDL